MGTVGDVCWKQAVDAFNKQHTPIIINTINIKKSAANNLKVRMKFLMIFTQVVSTTPITTDNSVKIAPTTGGCTKQQVMAALVRVNELLY